MAVLSKAEWKRRQRRKKYIVLGTAGALVLVIAFLLIFGVVNLIKNTLFREKTGTWEMAGDVPIQASLLTKNDYSRPGTALKSVKGVVIHFVGEPGIKAMGHRNYFEQLKILKKTAASAHFIVGFDGEIVQCIPVTEIAYATKDRNVDTIAVEYCHDDEGGKPNEKTLASLVKLIAEICKKYNLTEEDILRHYDVTGVDCPHYFVENDAAWKSFKQSVMAEVKKK